MSDARGHPDGAGDAGTTVKRDAGDRAGPARLRDRIAGLSGGAGTRWLTADRALRRSIRDRRNRFEWLRRSMREADVAMPYDRYLANIVWIATGVVALGVVAAAAAVAAGRPSVAAVAAALGLLCGASVAAGAVIAPRLRADRRAREIDAMLPFGLMVTSALSRAGMSLDEVVATFAECDGRYGALGREFAAVHRDVRYFGDDLLTALDAAREATPSDRFEEFLEDLTAVLASRSELTGFVEGKYEQQQEHATADQERFLGRLGSFAQVYVIMVFVAPILVIVLLVLLSFSGADTLPMIAVTAYVYPVAAVIVATAVLHAMEAGVRLPSVGDGEPDGDDEAPPPGDDAVMAAYRRGRRLDRLRGIDPVAAVTRRPTLSLVVTVPAVLLAGLVVIDRSGLDAATFAASRPLDATATVALGGAVVATPVALLYERQRRLRHRIVRETPDACSRLAEAVDVGMTPADACRVVSDRVGGPVGDELARIAAEARATQDVVGAFRRAAARQRVPEFGMSASAIAEAVRARNDVEDTLLALADATAARASMATERRRSMELYGIVVGLGLGTFLTIAVLLDLFFLPRLADLDEVARSGFLGRPQVPPGGYRPVLFRAALVQGAVNGLFVGKLQGGRLRDGLVYSVLFVVATTGVFLALAAFGP